MPDQTYIDILKNLKAKIQLARRRALLAVNSELLYAYWEIGNTILIQQKSEGWGTKVIKRLADDLRKEFPEMKGLSLRNFNYMRAFAEAYPQFNRQNDNVDQKSDNQVSAIVQQLAAQLPWTHHQVILDKTKTIEQRIFYIRKSVENGWSRNILSHQITSGLHLRQASLINNFSAVLPPERCDSVIETFKNPYVFDFLQTGEIAREADLEKGLTKHIRDFILELGRGFAFVGSQYRIRLEENEFFLDLLFFHYLLNCFVVFDLKIGEFKPEYAGKLNFYTTLVDEEVKLSEHKPTIGVLLCKSSDKTLVKYSLKNINSPLGVSTFELLKDLPPEIKTVMPTLEELEEEFDKEIKMREQNLSDLKTGDKKPEEQSNQ